MEVYKITNTINQKLYIGQTVKTAKKRFEDHKQAFKKYVKKGKNTTKLYNAFKEIGIENFKVEKIENCETREELDKREIYWIKNLNTMEQGYNTLPGGNSPRTTEQIKKTLREKAIKNFSSEKGKKIKAIISKTQKERIKNGEHEFCGKFGAEHYNHKKIRQLDVNGDLIGLYNGSFEAQRITKVNQSDIIKSCNNKRDHTPGGFIWVFDTITEQELKEKIDRVKKTKNKNKITIKNLETGVLTIFDNAAEAAKEWNVSRGLITHMVRENKKTNKRKNFEIL